MMTLNKPYFMAIDYSMSCPAITVGQSKDYKKCQSFFYCKQKKYAKSFNNQIHGLLQFPYENDMERFNNISDWVISIVEKFNIKEVVLEGYSMGSSKGLVFNIAENTGILKYKLWKHGVTVHTPSPSTIKKYFTGKGNAKKDMMHESFLNLTDLSIEDIMGSNKMKSPVSDVVDSAAMLFYGFDNYFLLD